MNSQVCESKNLSQLNQKCSLPIFVFSKHYQHDLNETKNCKPERRMAKHASTHASFESTQRMRRRMRLRRSGLW